jgi:hypothetical protein
MASDETSDREEGRESGRLHRLTRRLLDRGEDVRDLANSLLETSDRAKTEMVRMVAREVRNYLDELRLKEDLLHLLRSHSLELKLSVHLKPLADAMSETSPAAPAGSAPAPEAD